MSKRNLQTPRREVDMMQLKRITDDGPGKENWFDVLGYINQLEILSHPRVGVGFSPRVLRQYAPELAENIRTVFENIWNGRYGIAEELGDRAKMAYDDLQKAIKTGDFREFIPHNNPLTILGYQIASC